MILEIDPSNGLPIFLQIIRQVKYKIATGALEAGDQLPSVRQLATTLRVNPNTIAKAYNDLERDGVIQTRRGMGCFVASKPVIIEESERLQIVAEHLNRALTEAFHLKLPMEAVEKLFRERVQAFSNGRIS